MKKFLIATDLSPRSDRALNRALVLADEWEAELIVLHVVDEELPSSVADRLKADAESTIDDHLDGYPTLNRGKVVRSVIFGRPSKDIVEVAASAEVDLIILGTPRDETFGDFFLGTTAERVIRHGNDPVLIVKDRVKAPYKKVLVGIDFSVYSRRAVEFSQSLVPNGDIVVVHAYEVPFKGLGSGRTTRNEDSKRQQQQMDAMLTKEMDAFLSSLSSSSPGIERVLVEGMVRPVILGQVERTRADLLVVGTHGRTGLAHALLGSVARDLLGDPPCDVLAVKAW